MNASKKLILAFLASSLFVGAPFALNAEQIGTITGSATIVDADGNESPLTIESDIQSGNEIVTSGNSTVVIVFDDGTELVIQPNSRVIINSISSAGTVITVVSGSVAASAGNSLTLNTPTGNTTASNGNIGVNVASDGSTTVSNVNADVTTTPSGGTPQSVPPSTKVTVAQNGSGQTTVSTPTNLSQQETNQINNAGGSGTQQSGGSQFESTPETSVDTDIISESEPTDS